MVSPETEVTHHAQNLVPSSEPILGLGCHVRGFLDLLSVSLLPHPSHYLLPFLLGYWWLLLTQAQQVALPGCRHDEQPPLAEQIKVHTQVKGGPCNPSISLGSRRKAGTPLCLLSATNMFFPKVNRKTDGQAPDISWAGAHRSQPGFPPFLP